MTRFFIDPSSFSQDIIRLDAENEKHARVLRLKEGEQVLICDGLGHECLCDAVTSADHLEYRVVERRNSVSEARIRARVYMAMPKADKLEHVIQKATELGAEEIVTFPSARCVARPDAKSLKNKLERWQKIASAAAEQSGRGLIPTVRVLDSFTAAVKEAASADLPLFFYENEHAVTLHDALEGRSYRTVSIFTGPEGGLEAGEAELAASAGMSVCTLGSRILRCETAPLCALSAVMFASGEF